jgi:hypothetical protein
MIRAAMIQWNHRLTLPQLDVVFRIMSARPLGDRLGVGSWT